MRAARAGGRRHVPFRTPAHGHGRDDAVRPDFRNFLQRDAGADEDWQA